MVLTEITRQIERFYFGDRNYAAIHSAVPKQDELNTLQSQPLDKNSEEENKSD